MVAAMIEDTGAVLDGRVRRAHIATRTTIGMTRDMIQDMVAEMAVEMVEATAGVMGVNATPTRTSIRVVVETQAMEIPVTAIPAMETPITGMAVTEHETVALNSPSLGQPIAPSMAGPAMLIPMPIESVMGISPAR